MIGDPILVNQAVLVRRAGAAEDTAVDTFVRRLQGVIEPIGLAFSAALLTFLAAGARGDTRWGETVFLAFFLAIFSVLLFVYALGQSMPAWWGA